jgi:hypothetical protein
MLTPIAGSPYPTGMAPHAVELDPSGRFVYVANSGSNSVSVYCLDRVSGGLSPLETVPTPGSAFSMRIPAEADRHSDLMAIGIPAGSRPLFRSNPTGCL